MAKELADYGVLNELVQFYERDLKAVLRNEVTGGELALPTNPAALASLLTGALRRPQVGLVWGEDIAFSQLENWKPYITRSKKRFAIFAQSLKGKTQGALRLGKIPVFTSDRVGSLANLARGLPTLSSLLYITAKNENFAFISRLPDKIHVFANHGDSDKHSNMSRLSCAYDFVLVADSNAALRFVQNGIQLPLDRFVAMGGSVIDGVEAASTFGPVRRVLYAPTWEGYGDSVNFSSLLSVAPVLAQWPDAPRALRFRPHPGTGLRRPEYLAARGELGAVSPVRRSKTKAEDFNWSDAIITDISGVLSEYLYTRKPTIVPVAASNEWLSTYIAETPLREYVYLWDFENVGLDAIVQEATRDPLRTARIARRERLYYNASSAEESLALFDQALEYFEMTRRLRAMTTPRQVTASRRDPSSLFTLQPSDAALAAIVQSVRDGEVVLTG